MPSLFALFVLLLSSPSPPLDESALADAASIYLRDLGYDVRIEAGAPPAITPDSLASVRDRVHAEGARLAFWVERLQDRGGDQYVIYTVDGAGEVHALPTAAAGGAMLHRLLALKLRAVLMGLADREPSRRVPAPTPPSLPRGPYRVRAYLSAGYRLTTPVDTSQLRHGLFVEAALPINWVDLYLGTEVSTQPTRRIASGIGTLFDLPIRVGARARLRRSRFTGAVGPMVALHVLSVTAVDDEGNRGDSVRVAAGLGADLIGGVHLGERVTLELRGAFEWLLPENAFLLHGTTVFDVGGALFGAGAGVNIALP